MIEELKQLVQLVNSLPQLALWVAIGFWAYKVIIVGSIYGVIRFVVYKAYDAYMRPGRQEIHVALQDVVLFESKNKLVAELVRICPDRPLDSNVIEWLGQAITEKIEKDGLPKKKKPL